MLQYYLLKQNCYCSLLVRLMEHLRAIIPHILVIHTFHWTYLPTLCVAVTGSARGFLPGALHRFSAAPAAAATAAATEEPIQPPVDVKYTKLLINGNFVDAASGTRATRASTPPRRVHIHDR